MSTSDDLNRSAPPTLFGHQPEQQEGSDVRILADLEGRVPAPNAPKPAVKPRRQGVFAVVAVAVLAGAAGFWWFGQDDTVVADGTQKSPAPTLAAPPSQAGTEVAQPPVETTVSNARPDEDKPATVIDVPPAQIAQASPKADEFALDQLGKAPQAMAAAAVAGIAGSAAYAAVPKNQAPLASNKANAKSDLSNSKIATKPGSAPSQSATAQKKSEAKVAKASTGDAKRSTRKKKRGALAPDDPDADVLAALMAPPVSPATTSKARAKTTRTQ